MKVITKTCLVTCERWDQTGQTRSSSRQNQMTVRIMVHKACLWFGNSLSQGAPHASMHYSRLLSSIVLPLHSKIVAHFCGWADRSVELKNCEIQRFYIIHESAALFLDCGTVNVQYRKRAPTSPRRLLITVQHQHIEHAFDVTFCRHLVKTSVESFKNLILHLPHLARSTFEFQKQRQLHEYCTPVSSTQKQHSYLIQIYPSTNTVYDI